MDGQQFCLAASCHLTVAVIAVQQNTPAFSGDLLIDADPVEGILKN